MKQIDIRLCPAYGCAKIVGVYELESIPDKSEYSNLYYEGWDETCERACLHIATPRGAFDVEVNTLDKDGCQDECVYSDGEGYKSFFALTTVDESALSSGDKEKLNFLVEAIKNKEAYPESYDDRALLEMLDAIAEKNKGVADHFLPEYLKLSASKRAEDYSCCSNEILLIDVQPMDNYDMHFKLTLGDKEEFSYDKLQIISIKQSYEGYSAVLGKSLCKFDQEDSKGEFAWLDAIVYDGKLILRSYWDMGNFSYKNGNYAVVDKDIKDK